MNALLDVDVVLNTSSSEGFPAVVIEAWSAGKVVIARENSGCQAILHHGENGLLFDTPEECIELLDRVCSQEEVRKQLERSSKK